MDLLQDRWIENVVSHVDDDALRLIAAAAEEKRMVHGESGGEVRTELSRAFQRHREMLENVLERTPGFILDDTHVTTTPRNMVTLETPTGVRIAAASWKRGKGPYAKNEGRVGIHPLTDFAVIAHGIDGFSRAAATAQITTEEMLKHSYSTIYALDRARMQMGTKAEIKAHLGTVRIAMQSDGTMELQDSFIMGNMHFLITTKNDEVLCERNIPAADDKLHMTPQLILDPGARVHMYSEGISKILPTPLLLSFMRGKTAEECVHIVGDLTSHSTDDRSLVIMEIPEND